MDTGQIGTTAGVAALVSVLFQITLKPLIEAWLYKDGTPSPAYGLVCILSLGLLSLLVGALGAVVGLSFAKDKFIDLAIGGWVLAVFGYEALKNSKTVAKSLI